MNKGEPREQRAIVERAIEAGITYFDTSADRHQRAYWSRTYSGSPIQRFCVGAVLRTL
jgi:predicted aldo/keto reductase-like oxidoreductase